MYNFDKMALNDDQDISIIPHDTDMAEDSADEGDMLFRHFEVSSSRPFTRNTDSFQVLRKTYDELKHAYNNLNFKSEQKDRRIKDLENQLNAASSDYSTDSFLMVEPQSTEIGILQQRIKELEGKSEEPKQQSTDIGILQGRIKELERKSMIAEVEMKSLKAEKSQLEKTLAGLKNIDQNRGSLEKTKNMYLEEKVKKLTERLEKFSSLDSGRDIEQQLTELKKDMQQTKDENLAYVTQVRKLTDENATLKRQLYANSQNPRILSNGFTGSSSAEVTKELTNEQFSDMSLNSSLPAVDELKNLKYVIKKLKTVIETQNAYLLKLDSNPAVKKILRDEKLGLSMNGVLRSGNSSNRGSNSSVNNVGIGEDLADGRYPNHHSPRRVISPVGSNAKLIPNDTFSLFGNGSELKVDLPELEQYDNLESPSHRTLRQYQSKSQSEVISRMNGASRRESHTLRSTNSAPVFVKESARVPSLAASRESVYSYEKPNYGIGASSPANQLVAVSSNSTSQRESDRIPSIKTCPVCNADYTHKSVNEFQTHVFNCVDSEDQPSTLTCDSVPERICPMCNHLFPESCPQLEVDNHVNAHFGEAPTDAFEILHA